MYQHTDFSEKISLKRQSQNHKSYVSNSLYIYSSRSTSQAEDWTKPKKATINVDARGEVEYKRSQRQKEAENLREGDDQTERRKNERLVQQMSESENIYIHP